LSTPRPSISPPSIPSSTLLSRCFLKKKRIKKKPPQNTNKINLQALDKVYVPKHAKEFTVQQLFDFWARADNEGEMLRAKAVSIVGFFGLARTSELVGLKWSDVEERPDGVVVRLQRKKCAQDGSCDPVLIPRCRGHRIVPADVFLAYNASILAAPPQKDNRIWRRWDDRKKRWLAQPLGINKLKEIPKLVATFLGLSPQMAIAATAGVLRVRQPSPLMVALQHNFKLPGTGPRWVSPNNTSMLDQMQESALLLFWWDLTARRVVTVKRTLHLLPNLAHHLQKYNTPSSSTPP
jgi:hypothetical protein